MIFDDEIAAIFKKIESNIAVNWLGLVASKAHLTEVKVSTTSLGQLFVPWYWYDKEPVCQNRLKIDAAVFPKWQERWPQKGDDLTTIKEAAASGFVHPWFDEPALVKKLISVTSTLKLPAYEVPNGHLLLDGNHRAIAAFRKGLDVDLVVICGPIDERIIRDLAVFS